MSSSSSEIISISAPEEREIDVFFIHGLKGNALDSWTASASVDKNGVWLEWLAEELPNIGVFAYNYNTSIFEKLAKKDLDFYEQANLAIELMVTHGFGKRPIVFITHSLGGLLAKQILRECKDNEDEEWENIEQQTKLVAFIGTPHKGASLASAIKFIFPRLKSNIIDLLESENGFLDDLNNAYKKIASRNDIRTIAFSEKFKTKSLGVIVPKISADPGISGCKVIVLEKDHISISKPENRNDVLFRSIMRHIQTIAKAAIPPKDIDSAYDLSDYGKSEVGDRRDLLQKMIDSNRENEYSYVNELQINFAVKYKKRGLFDASVSSHDALLADIEQRFIQHVYISLICNSATNDEISSSIQEHIIEPICGKYNKDGMVKISPRAVLEGLYFLTEQCYIKWDNLT